MGEDGQFHAQDEAVDLSGTPVEAWVALASSGCWRGRLLPVLHPLCHERLRGLTEEIARYLLIATVFTGATIGVIKNNHIQVDFFYRFMPSPWRGAWPPRSTSCAPPSSPPPWC